MHCSGKFATPLFDDEDLAAKALYPEQWGVKNHLKSLWERFRLYADKDFRPSLNAAIKEMYLAATSDQDLSKSNWRLQQRYWEMNLVVGLLTRGVTIAPFGERPPAGPDILAVLGTQRVWIECVVPGPGQGHDAVLGPKPRIVYSVPRDPIMLRLATAIDEKQRKYSDYLRKGVVSGDDILLIAISGASIGFSNYDDDPPRIARLLHGAGAIGVSVDPLTGGVGEVFLEEKDSVLKHSGTAVPIAQYRSRTLQHIDGVIYSTATAFNHSTVPECELLYVGNPYGKLGRIPSWLTPGRECWVEELRGRSHLGTRVVAKGCA